jgi:hypothetical protein
MEKAKLVFDICITVFGLLAAAFAVLSLIYSSKIDFAKKIEEERLKAKVSESNAIAEKAKEEAAKAFENAASTNERSQKLELQVEEQKERAANAEKDLLILKDKIKPRSVPIDIANKLIDELKSFGIKEIHLSSSLGDGEALSYANQIKAIFEYAGWKVDSGIGFSTYTGVGVYILTKTNDNKDAEKLMKIFNSLGIKLQHQVNSEGVKIQIFIGSKNNLDTSSD